MHEPGGFLKKNVTRNSILLQRELINGKAEFRGNAKLIPKGLRTSLGHHPPAWF